MIFLNALGAGEPTGFVVILDDRRSYVADECSVREYETIMVDYEEAVAELDDIKQSEPSCGPTMIVERERKQI